MPGALFEEKPQSANDAWRKLHSDPLLMIRQREQEALAKIKNNPVKMAMIKKSVRLFLHFFYCKMRCHCLELTTSDIDCASLSYQLCLLLRYAIFVLKTVCFKGSEETGGK